MTYLNEISSNVQVLQIFMVVGVFMVAVVFLTMGLVVESKLKSVKIRKHK